MTPEQTAGIKRGDFVLIPHFQITESAILLKARLISRQFPSNKVAVVLVHSAEILILINPTLEWESSARFLNGRSVK